MSEHFEDAPGAIQVIKDQVKGKYGEWISVKKKLPDKNNWKVYAVLTNQDDLRKYQMAWFQHSTKTFRLENKPDHDLKVTHWMPLPEPPEEK